MAKAGRDIDMTGKDAARKFFELRESGYTGPIDQDGNAVECGPAAEILAALARTGTSK
jgi:hypothetical protein